MTARVEFSAACRGEAAEYRYRTTECDECGGQGGITYPEAAGYVTTRCDACDHTGELDATCADCLTVLPLDNEGFCRRCAEASILTADEWLARYGPRGTIPLGNDRHGVWL